MTKPILLVFSDLDGTLLDHHTYAHDAATPALQRAKSARVPIIIATSKTAAEVSALVDELELDAPAIVENGGGVVFPDGVGDALRAGPGERAGQRASPPDVSRNDIRSALSELHGDVRAAFVGFSQMRVEEIAAETGLTLAAAKNAAKREYSEPGLWIGDERQFSVFCETLERAGLQILQGGRFLHVMGRTNKSERMAQLKAAYQKTNPGAQILTAALGDAPNDAAMIEAADFGFIIANPHGKTMRRLPGEATGRIIRTTEPGPAGWNSAMNGLFDQLDIGTGKES